MIGHRISLTVETKRAMITADDSAVNAGIIRISFGRLMKKSIRVGEGIAEFFGTHDSNVKYLESLLNVQVHLQDETLTIDGPDEKVALVERLISDYLQLRSEGVRFSNGDLKSIIRIISEDESQSLRGVMSRSSQMSVGKRTLTPKTLNQKLYLDSIEKLSLIH